MHKERIAEIKDRLNEGLSMRNMRPNDLANKTGISKSAISYYVSGRFVPKADKIHLLSKALDVSEAWLMGFDVPSIRTPEQKKNDDLTKVIAQMRKDPDFFEVVCSLADLPSEEYVSIKQLISSLHKK